MMSDSEESISAELQAAAEEAVSSLIPEKSREAYELAYRKFLEWMTQKKVNTITEKIMLAYFQEKSKKIMPSTMWCEYSKLRTTINLNKNIDISKFSKLVALLKRKSDGYKGKKSKVFTKDEIEKFLTEADDNQYLMIKVLLITGIFGACRRQELLNLSIKNVKDCSSFIRIRIPNTKTKVSREFTVTKGNLRNLNLLNVFRNYVSLRSHKTSHERFFVGYRNGKCTVQPVGINTIGNVPSQIASFLKLDNVKEYTGHAFRRSSATLLAESGADISVLKRHGAWKTNTIAESYVDASIENKKMISEMILGAESPKPKRKKINDASTIENTVCGELAIKKSSKDLSLRKIQVVEEVTVSSFTKGIQFSHLSNCTINIYNK